jgi:uncharacterized membrane protein
MLIFAAFLTAISALVILLASPLFAVLGFEYSTIMALVLSLVCGLRGCYKLPPGASSIKSVVINSCVLALVPLVASLISLVFLPNCSLWDGFVFYLEIAYPSAILGGLFGLACSWLVKKRSKAVFLFIIFWVISLFLSFLPGYYNPQLYTYGWQYGFFPGIVWDESLELTNSYLIFRIENILWMILALLTAYQFHTKRRPKMWLVIPAIITITLFLFNDEFHITTSHNAVEKSLKNIVRPVSNCTVYYAPGSLTNDEIDKINRDIRWYLHDIEMRFFLHPLSEPISVYIYPSSDAMFDLIGTRTASISKPWLGELHIAKENLESLKHELTHVLLRQKGVFPFYVSWSTGLTEGAAMSVEPEYDGIYTLDEHAARILQMHYATGVKQVMSFSGFAANASQKSYVLAGSFSRYLLSAYGSLPFNHVYASLDWQKEYGKPIDSLEAEWKRWLAPMMTQMDAEDSELFRYYYDRTSIIYNPCLRRIGKLQREGSEAFRDHHFADAVNLYRQAIAEGAGIGALFDAERAFCAEGNWRGALAMLDTTRTPAIQKQVAALDIQRGDLHILANDTIAASEFYGDALSKKLGWLRFIFAYARQTLTHSDPELLWHNYIQNTFTVDSWDWKTADSLLSRMSSQYHTPEKSTFDRAQFAIDILRIDALIRIGKLNDAATLSPAIDPMAQLDQNDSLAVSLYLRERATLQPSSTGEIYSPIKYRRAAKEIADEINAEWKYLRSNPAALGRGTYP